MKLALLLALLCPLIVARQCSRTQYWSSQLIACISCTKCSTNQILLRPCSTHRDTECKTISDAGLDFPWLDDDKDNNIFELMNEDEDLPKKEKSTKKNKKHHLLKLTSAEDGDDDIYEDFLHSKHDFGTHRKNKMHNKHFAHHNQRINDKFMKWPEEKTNKKSRKNSLIFDPYQNLPSQKTHHHFTFLAEEDTTTESSKQRKTDGSAKRGKTLHAKHDPKAKPRTLYSEDDEEKLHEWLILSEKELAQRKEDLLKNIKRTELKGDYSEQKLKLNYPLYNVESSPMVPAMANSLQDTNKDKHKSIVNDEIFKELVKDNKESKVEIETLMSNKDSQHRDVPDSHRMLTDEPSTVSRIFNRVKNSEELVEEKIGNSMYQKTRLSVLPADDDSSAVSAVPFTAVERFVWDWQAVALISAVTACLLFFVVVMIYSLFTSNHPKRTKSSCYTADMEEMSTRIALMQPTYEPTPFQGPLARLPTTLSTTNEK